MKYEHKTKTKKQLIDELLEMRRRIAELEASESELKWAEKALRSSEERYRILYENNPSMYFTIDKEGNVLSVNQFGAEQLGYTPQELRGQSVLKVFHEDDKKVVLEQLITCLQRPEHVFQWELRKVCKDGKMIWVRETARAVQDAGDNTVIFVVCENITERKRIEEEFIKAEKLESIGILAGGIAHDFNNLLTSIMGNISLAKMYLDSGNKALEILGNAEKASMRAKDLTQQLLTFAKGGAPIKKVIRIEGLIKDLTSFTLKGSNVRGEFFISEDLWPVEVDEGQITQVIDNLIINARQAMPQDGVIKVRAENVIGVEYSLLKDGKYVKISVEDRGIGIPKEHIPKIFDPYFTTKQKGSGLGLTTTHSIVKKHGGFIAVESEVAVGTTFHIYLPASQEESPRREEAEEKLSIGKGRVLIMDDEEMIRDFVEKALSVLEYEVEFAVDGAQAIELYKRARQSGRPFDVIILDLTVPGGIGGKEVVKELIQIDPKVKAIVSSGYSNDPIMAEFRQYGFSGVIPKPYKIQQLNEVLNSVIAESGVT